MGVHNEVESIPQEAIATLLGEIREFSRTDTARRVGMPTEFRIQKFRNVKAWTSMLGGLEPYAANGVGMCAVKPSGFY
jgi:hypothetical protein